MFRTNEVSSPRYFSSLVILAGLVISMVIPTQTKICAGAKANAEPKADFGKLPLVFEENVGQTDESIKFLGRGNGYTLFLTDEGAMFKFRRPGKDSILKMQIVGANPAPQIKGMEQLEGKTNYFRGSDPKDWHSAISNYARVSYESIYRGIDLVYYTVDNELEYDLNVA